jgi:hypothetical protein
VRPLDLALLGMAAVTSAVVLTACGGGGGGVDRAGFTAGDRAAAQAALDSLRSTSVPTTLVQETGIAAAVPDVCQIRVQGGTPARFELFLFWTPAKISDPVLGAGDAAYTWFQATLSANTVEDTFHLGHANAKLPRTQVLNAHSGDVFSKPSARCQLLMNGYLKLQD